MKAIEPCGFTTKDATGWRPPLYVMKRVGH